MTDNSDNNVKTKKAPKRKSLLKRILDWICLAFFLLLVVGLIVLRAPWAVVAILIAILLANTVVSKPIRKWIWLTVAIIVATFVTWVFLPDDNKGWLPYTFDEELAAMEAKRSIPIEENAATIYNQLLESYDSNSFDKDFLYSEAEDVILSEFWEGSDYPEVVLWLESHQQIIEQLFLAYKKNKCRFPIAGDISTSGLKPATDFEEVADFWWSSGKRLSPMKRFGELLIISANNDIGDGRIDQGLNKYATALQMAKHLCQQPTHIDLLVGISIRMRVVNQINKYIVTDDVTDKHLSFFDKVLQGVEHNWESDLIKILDREKLMFKSFMCAMFYQTNSEGKIRLNRNPRSTLRYLIQPTCTLGPPGKSLKPMNPDSYGQIKLTKAISVLCRFFVPSKPQKTAVIIDDIYQHYYSMAEPEYDGQKEYGKYSLKSIRLNFQYLLEMMSRIFENNWPTIHDKYLQAATERRGSQLLIALRRHKNRTGQWPEKLEELNAMLPAELFIDPINNDSFIYRLTGDGFKLYSKGRNKIDENCEHEGLAYMQPCCSLRLSTDFVEDRADDILIWPPENSKSDKNNKSIKNED